MTGLEELNRMVLLCRDYVADELSDAEICHAFRNVKVLCVSDADNLSTNAGQTALATLVSLISRMGMQVSLEVPDVPVLFCQTPFTGSGLRTALLAASAKLVSCSKIDMVSGADFDVVFVLGNTRFSPEGAHGWRLAGTEWSGEITPLGAKTAPWSTNWAVGAMVSAALGASEAFKFVIRGLPLRSRGDMIFFESSTACNWTFGECPIPESTLDIGTVDFISAGAISQSAIYVLARLPGLELAGRIFDDDFTAPSNLNRNLLSLTSDVGAAKVKVVAHRCGALRITPIFSRYTKQIVCDQIASRVLVGVDDIPSRWEVQRQWPDWLAVGGTSHFNVSSSSHRPGHACAGCLHPLDDDGMDVRIPTVSFVSFWAGLSMAVRLLREALNRPYGIERQHLWITPLRMDMPHAAMWLPIAVQARCPVRCS